MQQTSSQPTSIRLTPETLTFLTAVSQETKRSRSYLVEESLKAYLGSIRQKELNTSPQERIARLQAIRGEGGKLTAAEIDARIRFIRGDE